MRKSFLYILRNHLRHLTSFALQIKVESCHVSEPVKPFFYNEQLTREQNRFFRKKLCNAIIRFKVKVSLKYALKSLQHDGCIVLKPTPRVSRLSTYNVHAPNDLTAYPLNFYFGKRHVNRRKVLFRRYWILTIITTCIVGRGKRKRYKNLQGEKAKLSYSGGKNSGPLR